MNYAKPALLLNVLFVSGLTVNAAQTLNSDKTTSPATPTDVKIVDANLAQSRSTPENLTGSGTDEPAVSAPLGDQSASLSFSAPRPAGVKVVYPFAPVGPQNEKPPLHVQGLSTRPWSTIVGWYPGPSAFSDSEARDVHFSALSLGAEPPQ